MKLRKIILILLPVLAVLIITGSCATTPDIKEEKEGAEVPIGRRGARVLDQGRLLGLCRLGPSKKSCTT